MAKMPRYIRLVQTRKDECGLFYDIEVDIQQMLADTHIRYMDITDRLDNG
jgi:hypothetical protein